MSASYRGCYGGMASDEMTLGGYLRPPTTQDFEHWATPQ